MQTLLGKYFKYSCLTFYKTLNKNSLSLNIHCLPNIQTVIISTLFSRFPFENYSEIVLIKALLIVEYK